MLEPLHRSLGGRYPKIVPKIAVEAKFHSPKGEAPSVHAGEVHFHGLFFASADESRQVQCRIDGFTFNHLKGYTTAEELFDEAFAAWDEYRSIAGVESVSRIALRYINMLDLPFRHGDPFERFLNAPITTPPDASQQVAEFNTRAVLHLPAPEPATAIVGQRLMHATERSTPFQLDIDVFREGEFTPDRGTLEPYLRSLRDAKNNLFFSYLTDDALEPYR